MTFFMTWLMLAFVQLAATMSPGPAFVVAVRNALAYDRRAGLFTALGFGIGVGFHAALVLCGLAYVISKSVLVYSLIKYIGAAYLLYMGVKALRTKKAEPVDVNKIAQGAGAEKKMSARKAVLCGILTNALNPKAVLFFTAVFTQFIAVDTPWTIQVLFGLTSVAIEILWFAGLAVFLTNPQIKQKFMTVVHLVERGCGGLMIALGLKLALTK